MIRYGWVDSINKMSETYSDSIMLGEYYQHNYIGPTSYNKATFIYRLDKPKYPNKCNLRLNWTTQPSTLDLVISKIIVLGGNGRVISHHKNGNREITIQFEPNDLTVERKPTVKYWIPLGLLTKDTAHIKIVVTETWTEK